MSASAPMADDVTLEGQGSPTSQRSASPDISRGAVIGRYVVLGRVGAGAMGVVYAAYDGQLERRVALKLIRGERAAGDEGRLVREARTMARLSHPNVLTVHDVGSAGTRVFIAMEFVDGETLTAWLKRDHRWQEIVATLIHAGRGLEAAHEAGILHRDFKPDNVMIDDRGRVRVMDFGLAAAAPTDAIALSSVMATPVGSDPFASKLSRSGHIVGTPAYLASEQFCGSPASQYSDQFAFCVALHEALYGYRPFAGATLPQLRHSVVQGVLADPPKRSQVPRAVWRVLKRGLSREAQERWPSMTVLLHELAATRRPRRRWLLGATLSGVAAITWMTWMMTSAAQEPCDGGQEQAAAAWGPARADTLATAFAAEQAAWVRGTWPRVQGGLDEWVQQWQATHRDACEATHIRHERSAELLDRATACLDGRMMEFVAAVGLLEAADPAGRRRAVELVAGLAPAKACSDSRRLLSQAPLPHDTEQAAAVASIQERMASVSALVAVGRFEDALAIVAELEPLAQATDYAPLLAGLHHRQAGLVGSRGDYKQRARLLAESYYEAVAARADLLSVAIASDLVYAYVDLEQHEQAEVWLNLGRATLVARVHDDGLAAKLATSAAQLMAKRGDYAAARAALARAIALDDRDSAELADALYAAGDVAVRLYDEQATALLERAHAMRLRVFGPEHPVCANSRIALGVAHKRTGDLRRARQVFEQGLADYERIYGAEHPNVAGALHNLGGVELDAENLDRARTLLTRALKIRRISFGDDHPLVAATTALLGTVAEYEGRLKEARRLYETSLASFELRLGPEHPYVADVLNNLGIVAARDGDHVAARQAHARALKIRTAQLGPDNLVVAASLTGLGEAQHALGAHDEAVVSLRRALASQVGANAEALNIAELRFSLAEALHASGEPGQAHDVALTARDTLRNASQGGHSDKKLAARIDQWLAQRPVHMQLR